MILELNVDYNRFFSKAIIALAREDNLKARMYLDRAAKVLSDIESKHEGDDKAAMQEWLFDIVKEVGDLENKIVKDRARARMAKILAEEEKERKASKSEAKNEPRYETNYTKPAKSFISRFASVEVPSTTFDDIAGLDNVKEAVKYKVIYPRKHPELYSTFKKRTGGGILLYGLPGTGKTLIAEAIAHETNATFFPVKCSDLGSKWFGETEQNLRDLFELARKAGNAVIFFDEIEAYASNRRENGAMERVVPEFLAQMQGVGASSEKDRILVIGATNKPWCLDGAFLRPGRFDEKIYVPLPCEQARKQIIQMRLEGVPTSEIDLQYFADRTEGFNCADVDYLCEKAKEQAIKRIIQNDEKLTSLCEDDFERAFSSIKSSVLDADLMEMKEWGKAYAV